MLYKILLNRGNFIEHLVDRHYFIYKSGVFKVCRLYDVFINEVLYLTKDVENAEKIIKGQGFKNVLHAIKVVDMVMVDVGIRRLGLFGRIHVIHGGVKDRSIKDVFVTGVITFDGRYGNCFSNHWGRLGN